MFDLLSNTLYQMLRIEMIISLAIIMYNINWAIPQFYTLEDHFFKKYAVERKEKANS